MTCVFVLGTVLLTVAVPGWLAWSVGLDRYRRAACRVVGVGLPGGPRAGALVTEGVGELAAEPAVFLGELAVALAGFGEPPEQGGVGGALAGGDGWRGGTAGGCAEPVDLGAQVGLVVEPGAGDPGRAGDGLEGDRGSGAVEFAQGADGLGAG